MNLLLKKWEFLHFGLKIFHPMEVGSINNLMGQLLKSETGRLSARKVNAAFGQGITSLVTDTKMPVSP